VKFLIRNQFTLNEQTQEWHSTGLAWLSIDDARVQTMHFNSTGRIIASVFLAGADAIGIFPMRKAESCELLSLYDGRGLVKLGVRGGFAGSNCH
jgi:hypothetical protein